MLFDVVWYRHQLQPSQSFHFWSKVYKIIRLAIILKVYVTLLGLHSPANPISLQCTPLWIKKINKLHSNDDLFTQYFFLIKKGVIWWLFHDDLRAKGKRNHKLVMGHCISLSSVQTVGSLWNTVKHTRSKLNRPQLWSILNYFYPEMEIISINLSLSLWPKGVTCGSFKWKE